MEELGEKKHKALFNLKMVSSSPVLLYYPQTLYLSAEWLQIESLWVEEILYCVITQRKAGAGEGEGRWGGESGFP